MKPEVVIKYLGFILLINSVFLFISFLISFSLQETSTISLLFSTLVCIIFGVFPLIFVETIDRINYKEGLTIIVLGWLITSVVGMLPYLMWGGEFTLINAWFESVSGFTTTGSTILNDIESLPKGLLFWRSSTHWIGGIGIIIFVLLILPQAKGTRLSILNTEISSLSKMHLRFNTQKMVRVLVIVYVGLTLLESIILTLFGMSIFDAVNHSFATIATGGFSTKNLNIAAFNNIGIEITIMVFMVLSGIHFGLIYGTVLLKKENIFKSSIVKTFLVVLFSGILLVTLKLYLSGIYDWWQAFRYAAFQVISLGTTTGFATIDTVYWPIFTQIILIYFTIQCAMAGSTSGGLKFDRVFIFFKAAKNQIKLLKHPHGVFPVKIDGNRIDEKLVNQSLVFIVLYFLIIFTTTFILTAIDIDGMTAFSASIATIGNVGPGFGNVSSLGNFANLPDLAKFTLTINMLFGRLEIFNILALIMIRK
jgi:trk system potassium uptake protein TrkH